MADDEMEFGLIESWRSIDDGELGLTPSQIFTLGYECADIKHRLNTGEAIKERMVSAHNENRIRSYCKEAERKFTLAWMVGDSSETWLCLDVEAGPTKHLK